MGDSRPSQPTQRREYSRSARRPTAAIAAKLCVAVFVVAARGAVLPLFGLLLAQAPNLTKVRTDRLAECSDGIGW